MNNQSTIETEKRGGSCAPVTGSAARCSKWEIWPLMMAFGFTCMAKSNGMAELILHAITIAALTYSISHRLTRRQNSVLADSGAETNQRK